MNENVFLWIYIHCCLYVTEFTLFYKAFSIYAFFKISGLIRKHQIFFNKDFHEDIDIMTIDPYFYHISTVKPFS